MIHSARPIVTPVANIVFCCFVFLDLKSGDGRTDNMTLVWPSGSISTEKKNDFVSSNITLWVKIFKQGMIFLCYTD